MRLATIGIIMAILPSLAAAQQQPTATNLYLRGDRIKPLTIEQLTTPDQKLMVEELLASGRGSEATFNSLLRSPEIGRLSIQLGVQLRAHSSLPKPLFELAVLRTLRFWTAQFEWGLHHQVALKAGLSPAIIQSIADNKRPASMKPEQAAIYNFADELLRTRHVSDATFKAVEDRFGDRGVVDLTALVGYYSMVSAIMEVDRYPLRPGDKPELKALK